TEGIGNSDAFFNRNWRQCKEAGLVRGAYHFFLPTKDGKMQAENFIKIVNLRKGDLPPVLDIEQTYGVSKIQLQREALKWLQTIEGYYKVKPIIYTNVDFYKNNLGDNFNEYPLWVAHYLQPREPRIKRDWVFWQHNEQGRVNGILTNVDFNVFSGDSTDFQKLRIQ
ncbi:MAG: glycoside hydrolase family 25 protein, partial [Bacteroidetes bacterium]|nr:glycoside hydrolase family 25 protein [Bacteroidota bacterium]